MKTSLSARLKRCWTSTTRSPIEPVLSKRYERRHHNVAERHFGSTPKRKVGQILKIFFSSFLDVQALQFVLKIAVLVLQVTNDCECSYSVM